MTWKVQSLLPQAPGGDVPDLGEDLVHDNFIQKCAALLPVLLRQLVHRLLQPGSGGIDRTLLSHIAAVQPGGGTGEGQGLLPDKGAGGAGHGVLPPAEQAGDLHLNPVGEKVHRDL